MVYGDNRLLYLAQGEGQMRHKFSNNILSIIILLVIITISAPIFRFNSPAFETDRSSPSQPPEANIAYLPVDQLGTFNDGGIATDLSFNTNQTLAFVADGLDGIEILNISDPTNILEVGQYSNGEFAVDVVIDEENTLMFAIFENYGLEILNFSDFTHIQKIANVSGSPYLQCIDVKKQDNSLFIANGEEGVEIFNVSTPSLPVLQTHLDTNGSAADLEIDADRALLFIADGDEGLLSFNITDINAIEFIEAYNFNLLGTVTQLSRFQNTIAYVDSINGILLLSVNDTGNFHFSSQYFDGSIYQAIVLSNTTLYAARTLGDIVLINCTDTSDPQLLQVFSTPATFRFKISASYAFLANQAEGFEILDLGIDFDEDGLSDARETFIFHTSPTTNDTDDDQLPDGDEILIYLTDPLLNDTDGDRLLDGSEVFFYGTDPTDADSDNDLVEDGDEVLIYGTNPLNADTDFDGMPDGWEITYFPHLSAIDGSDNMTDFDSDSLMNYLEYQYYCNPIHNDTDLDTLLDGDEVFLYFTDPTSNDTDLDTLYDNEELFQYLTSPILNDTDSDGLFDNAEIFDTLTNPRLNDTDWDALLDGEEIFLYGTNPLLNDSDSDLILDGEEVHIYHTNPTKNDTDNDTLLDGQEIRTFGTNPLSWDTDFDFFSDSYEISNGFDPLNQSDHHSTYLGEKYTSSHSISLIYACQDADSCSPDTEVELSVTFELVAQNFTHFCLAVNSSNFNLDSIQFSYKYSFYQLLGNTSYIIFQGTYNHDIFSVEISGQVHYTQCSSVDPLTGRCEELQESTYYVLWTDSFFFEVTTIPPEEPTPDEPFNLLDFIPINVYYLAGAVTVLIGSYYIIKKIRRKLRLK